MIPVSSGGDAASIAASLREAVAPVISLSSPQSQTLQEIIFPDGAGKTNFPRRPSFVTHRAGRQQGIAVAIPGPFDYREGIFLMDHKFQSVKGRSFRELAAVPEDVEIRFRHDVVAALEGCLEEEVNTALVTIGTGLGFCIAVDGKPRVLESGSPADSLWNAPYGDGILEDKVSARGIRDSYREKTGRTDVSALQIALLADGGDIPAMEVYSEVGTLLGDVLLEKAEEYGVERFLFGGQVSRSLHLMERPIRNALDGIRVEKAPEGAVFRGLSKLF